MVHLRNWGAYLSSRWQQIKTQLTLSSDPQVWQSVDQSGNSVWSAYDPMTGRAIDQVSDQELRVWLEERYHRQQSVTERRIQQLKVSALSQM